MLADCHYYSAIQSFNKSIVYRENDSEAYYYLGICYGILGFTALEKIFMKEAVERGNEEAKEFLEDTQEKRYERYMDIARKHNIF
jgi:tetratricopeptide (TPR) repeat protein